jgi:phosphatidylinositol dimannoside acyltransferase
LTAPAIPHTDIATMTQAMADAFAEQIAAHPQDWHMLQRLWHDDLESRPAATAALTRPSEIVPSDPGL